MCRLNPGEQADRLCQVYDDILSKGLLAPNGSFVPGAEDAAGTEVVQLREMLLQLYRSATPEADTWLHMLQHSEDPETSLPFTEEQVVRSLNVLILAAAVDALLERVDDRHARRGATTVRLACDGQVRASQAHGVIARCRVALPESSRTCSRLRPIASRHFMYAMPRPA